MTALLAACFALSGAASLALEMLWMRSAALVAGGTAATVATVLASYFGGLAWGASLGRRGAAAPIRRYALLELGAAAGAAWSVFVFGWLATDAAQRAIGDWPGAAALAITAAVLPATVYMGATLPAIGDAVLRRGMLATAGGLLYAVNTIGGALGLAAAGFGLPVMVGVRASYAIAIAASAFAGVVALAIARAREPAAAMDGARTTSVPGRGSAPASEETRRFHARLCAIAAATGAAGLAVEVLWTRLFAQVLHNSVYSFTAVALVFVVALAAGAVAAARVLGRVSADDVLAGALSAAGVATVAGFWIFVRATDGLAYVGMERGLGEYLTRIVALAAVTAGPAAVASGMLLPALWAAWRDDHGVAPALGIVSAANLGGAAVGAAGAGFVLLPHLGTRAGVLVIAIAYLAIALAVARPGGTVRRIALASLLLVVIADPARAPIVHLSDANESARAVLEDGAGIVSVVAGADDLQLRLDNYYVLGGTAAATNERRLGLLPLLLHPQPLHVAFIGLATGITASAAPALAVPHTTVIELVPPVIAAAGTHFRAWNGDLLERPEVRVVAGDGRRWLQATGERFDVIVSDLFVPWHAGTTSLYAREMYETVARRLAPGGLFCQWLPLYQLTREEFDVIAHTFATVFPDARLWRADFYPDRPVVGLIGRREPAPADLDHIAGRIARLPTWGRDPLLASPLGLAMLYAGDVHSLDGALATAPLNEDDRPRIEFLAPHLTRISAAGDKDWLTGDALAELYDELASRDPAPGPFADAGAPAADARRAGRALYRYAIAAAHHDDLASDLEREVRRLAPDVVAAAELAPVDDALADARRGLAALRDEQGDVQRRLESVERRLRELGGTSDP